MRKAVVMNKKTTPYLELRLALRLTPEEKAHAEAQAEAAGMSVSALIRALLAGVHIRAISDVKMLAELRRLGGLIKQAYSAGTDPIMTLAALHALQAAAARIAPRTDNDDSPLLPQNRIKS